MKIPFNYLNKQFKSINPYRKDCNNLIKSSQFTIGPYVENFEKKFADFEKHFRGFAKLNFVEGKFLKY